jgi:hypothetical protein
VGEDDERHGISGPIHMKEFGPHGRFAQVTPEKRRGVFAEIAQVIDWYSLFTVGAWLSNDEFKAHFPETIRKAFGVYGMCFNLAAMTTHKKAEADGYRERISFILDSGNPYKHHTLGAHDSMLKMQKEVFLHIGSLTFEADNNLGILQGADVVAWGLRRRLSSQLFGYSFEPIKRIFETNHVESPWHPEWLKMLSGNLQKKEAELKAAAEGKKG